MLDWGGVQDLLIELHGRNHDLTIEGISKPARVDTRSGERVGGGDPDRASGEWVLEREVETACVVVEVLECGRRVLQEPGEDGGELLLVAGL